jgi:lysophospholipase L1-like esterase
VPLGRARLRLLAGAALIAAVTAAGLALVWSEVLPGAWTLRGWVLGREGRASWQRERGIARQLDLYRQENPTVPPGSILFVGASTILRFPLARHFPGRPCVNRGLEGATAEHLLEHLEALLPPAPPDAVVLAIGGNDLRREGLEPVEVASHVTRLLDRLAEHFPEVPIALLGCHPVRGTDEAERARLERYEELLRELATARGMAFVAADRPPLRGPDGALPAELAADELHLNEAGYGHLAGWLLADGGAVAAKLAP